MKRRACFSICIMLIISLSMAFTACQSAEASPIPTIVPTVTVAPATPTIAPAKEPTPSPSPKVTPSPTPTPDPEEVQAIFVDTMLEYVNEARVENGLKELTLSPALCAAAAIRADEFRQKFEAVNEPNRLTIDISIEIAHSRLGGEAFWTALEEVGITDIDGVGENLVADYISRISTHKDATLAFKRWQSSTGHWENILKSYWTKTGIAVVYTNYGYFACQLFTNCHGEPRVVLTPIPATSAPESGETS